MSTIVPDVMMGGTPEGGAESPSHALRAAIEHAQLAQTLEQDDVRSQRISKAIAMLYDIFAQQQKDRDKVMGLSTGLRSAISG
jgi:hypothetical protein